MTSSDSYGEFADPSLSLTWRGTAYAVASPSAWEGLRLRRLLDANIENVNDENEIRGILGATLDVLAADRVDREIVHHMGRTALVHYGRGPEAGLALWTFGRSLDLLPPDAPVDESAPGFMGPSDPGGGPIVDRERMIRRWFNPPALAPKPNVLEGVTLSWADIFKCWTELELDFDARGYDLGGDILHTRTWRWFEIRAHDIARSPSTRLYRAIFTPTK